MPRYGSLDYSRFTKRGFQVGVVLFTIGLLGELAFPAFVGPLQAWQDTLFLDLEVIGVLVGLFAPVLFGIVLPLTE